MAPAATTSAPRLVNDGLTDAGTLHVRPALDVPISVPPLYVSTYIVPHPCVPLGVCEDKLMSGTKLHDVVAFVETVIV